MKKTFLILIISVAVISGILTAEYAINSGFKDVRTEAVSKTTMESYIELTGDVIETNKREIKVEFPFVLSRLYVSVGDEVSKGEKLAVLDKEPMLKKLELAMAEASAPDSFESVIATVKSYKDEITSPIKGVISQLNCTEGGEISAERPVIVIKDTENLIVRTKIPSDGFKEIYLNQKVIIYSDTSAVNGKITKIYPTAEKSEGDSRSFVAFEITPESCEDLTCGAAVDLKLCSEVFEDVVVIPFDSVMFDEEYPYVYVNISGYAVKRRVVLGKEFETTVEIKEGLSENDRLVLSPKSSNIKNGDKLSDGE